MAAAYDTVFRRSFSNGGDTNDGSNQDISANPIQDKDNIYNPVEIMKTFQDTSYVLEDDDVDPSTIGKDGRRYPHMTNDELMDTSNIPGWEFIHSPPKAVRGDIPRGALVGTVVSTKMMKTVNVAIDRYKIHPLYRKRMRYTRKFMAHDEQEVANSGDLVMIVPCQRISRHKHFMVREIIRPKGQL